MRTLAGAVVVAHALWFLGPTLACRFAPDEMMNMGWAWEAGPARILWGLAAFAGDFYRPTGALYYWTLHRLFGLDPLPFRVFDLGHLLLNLWLAYRLALLVTKARPVAWLTALLFSYHGGVTLTAAYSGAYVYDRLCFTFLMLTLDAYMRVRLAGGAFGPRQWGKILGWYLLALGSKEMAAAAPLLLAAFEATQGGLREWRKLRLLAVLLAMTGLYAYGRTHHGELAGNTAYAQTISVGKYFASQGRHLQDYLFLEQAVPGVAAALILGALTALAWWRRRVRWAVAFLWMAPLPIAFVDRAGGALYIPLFGWCLAVALLVEQAAGQRRAIQQSVAVALALLLCYKNSEYFFSERERFYRNGDQTWRAIEDLRRLDVKPAPGALIYVARDPFVGWDLHFMLRLWANVKPIEIRTVGKSSNAGEGPPAGTTLALTLDDAGHLVPLSRVLPPTP